LIYKSNALNLSVNTEKVVPTTPYNTGFLPCYDFTTFTNQALSVSLLAFKITISSIVDSHGVMGSVYKAREDIDRRIADRRLLAIPTSCRRVAAYNPN
jgi:hypothetical protein